MWTLFELLPIVYFKMASSNKFGEYSPTVEPWENWEIRFDAWLLVQDITTPDKKRAALISEVGPTAFATLKDLAFPSKVLEKTYDDLIELLRKFYKQSRTSMLDRMRLHHRNQGETETVTEYIAALKKIATNCNYGDELEARLRDQFMFGLRSEKIVNRLLEESQKPTAATTFTWQSATTLALSMEGVHADAKEIKNPTDVRNKGDVHHVRDGFRGGQRGGFRGAWRGYHQQSFRPASNFGGRGRGQYSQPQSFQQNNQSSRGNYQPSRGNYQPSRGSYQPSRGARTPRDSQTRPEQNQQTQNSQYSSECYSCGQRGHFQRDCSRFQNTRRQDSRARGRVRHVYEDSYDIDCDNCYDGYLYNGDCVHDSYCDDYLYNEQGSCDVDDLSATFQNLFSVSDDSNVRVPPEYVETLRINNVPVRFVIDTACPVGLIPITMYEKYFSNVSLKESDLKLTSYSKHAVPVKGFTMVDVYYGGKNYRLPLYVTEGDDACLLGRQWLEKIPIHWQRVFTVKTQVQGNEIQDLLNEFKDVFDERPGSIKGFQADVRVKDGAKPLFHKPRPVPYALREQVSQDLDKLESLGIITKIESSEWAAPLVVVPKGDKTLRLCGDYKVTVNQVVHNDVYPLPNADDLFASLGGGEVFTKLDLSAAYQQLELTESAKKFLVVNTQKGLYQYNRLSYGVSTAPSIFQRVMDQILQGIDGVQCYLDDILIASRKSDHVAKVKCVLERLRKYGVQLKLKKCSFMMAKVKYLGHEVSAGGIQPTEDKIQAIKKMRAPQDVHELRVLLGMVNYYAKFLPDLATLLAPWYRLLKKGTKFEWCKNCETAFDRVKKLLTNDRLLVHFDANKKLVLACDASPVGLGCVLSHVCEGVERPIAFASRSLTAAERNYCQLEREGLAIIYGLTKFHKYVYGRKITIVTDNKPITRILGPKVGVPSLAALRLQRWAMVLMAHDYELRFRSSKDHGNVDGLSRFPASSDHYLGQEVPVNYFSYVNDLPIDSKNIQSATRKDPLLSQIVKFVMSGWPAQCDQDELKPYFNRRNELSVDQGCLLWGCRVVIPPCYRKKLLEELHRTHPGVVKMKAMARSYLWFPGLDSEIETLVNACSVCQSVQKSPPVAPLIPWTFPGRCWERIHIDFADFERQSYLIVVDAYSKWLEVIEMSTTTTHRTIQELRKLFASHGLPVVLVSDNGPQLVSVEMENFLRNNGIKHLLSEPYHPATNGAAERCVQTVKNALKKHLLSSNQGDLSHALQCFLLNYRSTAHATTGRSPAELFLKRDLRTRFSLLRPDVTTFVHQRQEKQVENHDKCVRLPTTFQVGEIVRVKNTKDGLERFVKGVVAKVVGPYRFLVKVGTRCRFVHLDHLRKTGELDYDEVITNLNYGDNVTLNVPQHVIHDTSPVHDTYQDMSPPTPMSPRSMFQPSPPSPRPVPPVPPSPRPVPHGPSAPSSNVVGEPPSVPIPMPERRSMRNSKPPDRLIESM